MQKKYRLYKMLKIDQTSSGKSTNNKRKQYKRQNKWQQQNRKFYFKNYKTRGTKKDAKKYKMQTKIYETLNTDVEHIQKRKHS